MNLSEYILLPRTERIAHIDLSLPCDFSRHGHSLKHILLDYLQIENDVENWTKGRIHRCHLCGHGRGNGWCINPQHFYFGTASENQLDLPKEFRVRRSSIKNGGWIQKKNLEKFELFKSEYSTDVSLHSWSLRKLGRRYGVCNQAIKKWIDLL